MGTSPTRPESRENPLLDLSVPLTRASGVAPLVAFLDSLGAPTSRLLRQARIPPGLLDEAEGLVPLHLVHRLVEITGRWADIDNLGVVLGQRTSAFNLGAFGQLLGRALTVFDYLQTGARLIGSVTSGEQFWLTREGEQVRFHHFQPGHPGAGRCQSDLYALVVTISMLRRFLGQEWNPRDVRLLATDACMVGDLTVFGDAEVRLNQSHSSFTMPLSTLSQAVPASVRSRIAPSARVPQLKPDVPTGFVDSIELLVAELMMAGGLDIEVVAEAAGTTTRTLQRRLHTFGLSYSTLVQQARLSLASDWLAGSAMPISDIANVLGYRDPAHFSRAFRRKSGISPRQYRSQHH